MAQASLTTQDAGVLGQVLNEVLDILFSEAEERIAAKTGQPGAAIPYSDRMKIDLARKVLSLSKRYNADARFRKAVHCSNAIIPCLTRLFGAETVASRLPPKARDPRVVELCDKAGANELADLIRVSSGATAPFESVDRLVARSDSR